METALKPVYRRRAGAPPEVNDEPVMMACGLSTLLQEFRHYVEVQNRVSITELEVNAGQMLYDLAVYLGLGPDKRLCILGRKNLLFIETGRRAMSERAEFRE